MLLCKGWELFFQIYSKQTEHFLRLGVAPKRRLYDTSIRLVHNPVRASAW